MAGIRTNRNFLFPVVTDSDKQNVEQQRNPARSPLRSSSIYPNLVGEHQREARTGRPAHTTHARTPRRPAAAPPLLPVPYLPIGRGRDDAAASSVPQRPTETTSRPCRPAAVTERALALARAADDDARRTSTPPFPLLVCYVRRVGAGGRGAHARARCAARRSAGSAAAAQLAGR